MEEKETKGLFAKIMEGGHVDELKSSLTLQDWGDMFKAEEKRASEHINTLHVGGGLMLSCSDEQFVILWSNHGTECYCSIDAHKQILERAKKLKLI